VHLPLEIIILHDFCVFTALKYAFLRQLNKFAASKTGITTVLTLSTISLDSRTDLPKVRYATALDWFLLMSFFYCIATLLEFAGVHYFTKVESPNNNFIASFCLGNNYLHRWDTVKFR
jgi:Neurotransmitter-gated ion-channel transmembrane region